MSTIRRYQRMRPSRGTTWPPEVRAAIVERDQGRCVCARAGFPLDVIAKCPAWPIELDHVRSGGMGMKSRSTVDNGAALSNQCHAWKTSNGRIARPLLLAYIAEQAEDDCGHIDPRWDCDTCQSRKVSA